MPRLVLPLTDSFNPCPGSSSPTPRMAEGSRPAPMLEDISFCESYYG
jgi:hypothetical protein